MRFFLNLSWHLLLEGSSVGWPSCEANHERGARGMGEIKSAMRFDKPLSQVSSMHFQLNEEYSGKEAATSGAEALISGAADVLDAPWPGPYPASDVHWGYSLPTDHPRECRCLRGQCRGVPWRCLAKQADQKKLGLPAYRALP